MMYMEDALDSTLKLMAAPKEKITVRSSYNIGALSFSPEELASEIQAVIPDFTISYKPDFRQQIAESWPGSIDDSVSRRDWGWKPAFDLKAMVKEMLQRLPEHHNLVEAQ